MSAQANAIVYKNIVSDFNAIAGARDNPYEITRWMLISKGYPVGLFISHFEANNHLKKMHPEEKDDETLIIPFFHKMMYGYERNSTWSKDIIVDKLKNYLMLQKSTGIESRVGYTEIMFLYMMNFPEFLIEHQKLYEILVKIVGRFKKTIRANPSKFQQSRIILTEMPRFLNEVKANEKFVASKPTHNYNLRKRKYNH